MKDEHVLGDGDPVSLTEFRQLYNPVVVTASETYAANRVEKEKSIVVVDQVEDETAEAGLGLDAPKAISKSPRASFSRGGGSVSTRSRPPPRKVPGPLVGEANKVNSLPIHNKR